MRRAVSVIFVLLLGACAAAPDPVAGTPCPEPRPQICTREYNPACAVLATGERREYPTACTACADAAVVAFEPGRCPE